MATQVERGGEGRWFGRESESSVPFFHANRATAKPLPSVVPFSAGFFLLFSYLLLNTAEIWRVYGHNIRKFGVDLMRTETNVES